MIRGDEAARDRFVRLCAPRAWAIFRNHFRFDADTAEDLFQQLFLHLAEDDFRRLKTFRGDSRFATWFARVCRNFATDHLRARRPRERQAGEMGGPIEFLDEIPGASDPIDEVCIAELRRHVSELLEFLPENHRQILRMYYHEGLDYQDIALRSGDSVNHVGVKLSRARGMLKRLIALHAPGLAREFDEE